MSRLLSSIRLCTSISRSFGSRVENLNNPVESFSILANSFQTNEINPKNHTQEHHGQFYTLPNDEKSRLFTVYNWNRETHEYFDVMHETAIMIRQPALTIIKHIKEADFSKPLHRFLLTGRTGVGKSFTLTHLTHFAHKSDFVVLHCVSPNRFTRYPQDSTPSESRPGRIDCPLDAALFLQHFRASNSNLISHLRTSKTYTWSMRESTKEGEPLLNVIDHGINRIKHASDCFAVLLKELKLSAQQDKCKVIVLLDKFNLFYWPTFVRQPNRDYAEHKDITVVRAIKKLFWQDWNNAALIGVCDPFKGNEFDPVVKSPSAIHVLGEKAIKALTPFTEVPVPCYDEKEYFSCLEYFNSRKFLTHPAIFTDEGRNEIKFISALNPLDVYEACKPL